MYHRTRYLLAALAVSIAFLAACDVTKEGDACNALLTSPEQCDPGLYCTTSDNCTSAACCPADAATSTNPNCQACPAPAPDASDMGDAGMGEGG